MLKRVVFVIVVLTLLLTVGCMKNSSTPKATESQPTEDTIDQPAELNLDVEQVGTNDELENIDLNIDDNELENLDF